MVVTSGVAFKNEIEQVLNAKKERQIPVIQPLSLAVASLPPWYVHRIVYFTFEWLEKQPKAHTHPQKVFLEFLFVQLMKTRIMRFSKRILPTVLPLPLAKRN